MKLTNETINCQIPIDGRYIEKTFNIINVVINKNSSEYIEILNEAKKLSGLVNTGAANDSNFSRNELLLLTDSFGGLLSEKAWLQFLNENLGEIANLTDFITASNQIDIKLNNGELIEVRSSFIRNGVKFGICSTNYNFKNIGPYSNSIKPGEIQKNLYCGVLFETQKRDILNSETINFSLVGSSTWQMMIEKGFNTELNAWDSFAVKPGTYKVLYYKDTMDVLELIDYLKKIGY